MIGTYALLHFQMVGLYKDPHGKKIEMTSSIGTHKQSTQDQSSGEATIEELRREVSQLKMDLRKYKV